MSFDSDEIRFMNSEKKGSKIWETVSYDSKSQLAQYRETMYILRSGFYTWNSTIRNKERKPCKCQITWRRNTHEREKVRGWKWTPGDRGKEERRPLVKISKSELTHATLHQQVLRILCHPNVWWQHFLDNLRHGCWIKHLERREGGKKS